MRSEVLAKKNEAEPRAFVPATRFWGATHGYRVRSTPSVRFIPLSHMAPQTLNLFWFADVSKNPWNLGSTDHVCFMWNIYVIYLYTRFMNNLVNPLFWGTTDQTMQRQLFLQSLYIKKPHYFFQKLYIKKGGRWMVI